MKRYKGKDIEVTYDSARCLHAAECVRGLPAVFNTAERPWIDPDAADADSLSAVIRRCPTDALHYTRRDGEPERPSVRPESALRREARFWLRATSNSAGTRDTGRHLSVWRVGQPALLRPQRAMPGLGV